MSMAEEYAALRSGRLAGRSAIITGGAGGFGAGIARELIVEGARVCVADIDYAGAQAVASGLCELRKDAALPFRVDVCSEDSVRDMVDFTVERFGRLDIMISNAGIVDAGGLEDMTLERFERVTRVNYTAFFLCAKYASHAMKAQRAAGEERMYDIIEINSKSGLEGSMKNFAYAGSKFGGIGLVQSFAKELAPCGIKVNAICPGNFLDGALWSDPERGLLKQYLDAGKVPGATTLDEVRAYYESKVPLGRGCTPLDVTRAILYCVEQQYETGQALPVTGGQVMLS